MDCLRRKPVLENLQVLDIAAEGKAIARYEGIVVFVSNCIPGDIVDVQVTRRQKKHMEGYPVKFHAYSRNRTTPFCIHFGVCGGCSWQQLPYTEQLKYKQKQVADNLERIGKVEVNLISSIIASEKQIYYRNKMEYTFSHNRWLTNAEIQSEIQVEERRALGFHIPGKFSKVLHIDKCYLQPEPSNQIRNFVFQYALKNNLGFFDLIHQTGFLRNLIIRNSLAGEIMTIFLFFKDDHDDITKLLNAVASNFPQITSMMYAINSKANDTFNDLKIILYKGRDHLIEKMDGLSFRISAKSFFQTNTSQANQLYLTAREFAGLSGDETVYDLYTGTGTIALYLGRHCKKVIGIENVSDAIADAKINARINGINNVNFYTGDIRDIMNESFLNEHGNPDVVITDPPRTGMHPNVIQSIISAKPARIVYVSCNPATQARDIHFLSPHYKVLRMQPIDMFPHTHHVENIALLNRIY
jgi:23S rRNA (uracil1939-C5)-methyltransferase